MSVGEGSVVGAVVVVVVAVSVGALVGVGCSSSTAVHPIKKVTNNIKMIDFLKDFFIFSLWNDIRHSDFTRFYYNGHGNGIMESNKTS